MSGPLAAGISLRPLCPLADLIAHTPSPNGRWHSLGAHSRDVGDLAAEFAESFGASDFARLLGYLHDAGKATDDIQQRLRARALDRGERRRPLGSPHKMEGAALAAAALGAENHLATWAYLACYGHHGGIPSRRDPVTHDDVRRALAQPEALTPLRELMDHVTATDLSALALRCQTPARLLADCSKGLSHFELFTRMCHSTLVDADFLDTAAHFQDRDSVWQGAQRGMPFLRDVFMGTYVRRYADAPDTALNRIRGEVLAASMSAAVIREGGIFRLPAPTGTGKTMAAAAFALHHAARFGKRRVIVAVPFTTITTQNAAEYRDMFPDLSDVVLEHHSEVVDQGSEDNAWRQLSATQWDGEFVVTTTVQLFESLFSNRPSRTRKLHRIVDSVIVLDEVQALPLDLLAPILGMLRELTEHYGVTVLLASATQPAFWELPAFQGLPVHDILPVDSVPDLTQRVTYTVRDTRQSWEQIAGELVTREQALTVVNTRKDADLLFTLLRGGSPAPHRVYLLSRSMTSDHRRRVLDDVRSLLDAGERVLLVSTQLIEAGVDVDFPVVYRAMAPADSIVQAAGRCNRNGALAGRGGEVVVFDPEGGGMPGGLYSALTATTRSQFVARQPNSARFDSPEALFHYYREVYWRNPQIKAGAVKFAGLRGTADFPATSREFQMIKDDSGIEVVVTRHPDARVSAAIAEALAHLRANPMVPVDRETRRFLGRYTANVSRADAASLALELSQGLVEWSGEYDPRRGAIGDVGLTW